MHVSLAAIAIASYIVNGKPMDEHRSFGDEGKDLYRRGHVRLLEACDSNEVVATYRGNRGFEMAACAAKLAELYPTLMKAYGRTA